MKTYRFNCFYNLPNSLVFTVFEKKFNSLSELAKFVASSDRIYLDNPREQLNSSEFQIFSKKMQSLFNNKTTYYGRTVCGSHADEGLIV